MAVNNNYEIYLNYWDSQVSINASKLCLSIADGAYCSSIIDKNIVGVTGWYANYPEGIFVFFEDADGRLLIGWDGHLIDVQLIHLISWDSSVSGRLFVCYDKNQIELLKVPYRTLKRLMLNPIKLVGELVAPNDDWGLVADLPSFIHSCFVDGDLQGKYKKLFQREGV